MCSTTIADSNFLLVRYRKMSHIKEALKAKFSSQKDQQKKSKEKKDDVAVVLSEDVTERDVCELHELAHDICMPEDGTCNELYNNLTEMQEQLLAAMLENEGLKKELDAAESKKNTMELQRQLQHEKLKCLALEDKIQQLIKAQDTRMGADGIETVDVAQEALEVDKEQVFGFRQRWHNYIQNIFGSIMADFTETEEEEEALEEESLTVKKLKTNVVRFRAGIQPIVNTIKGTKALFSWKYPTATCFTFMVYMYAVWMGWILQVTLFTVIFRLFLNLLITRGHNIHLFLLWEYQDTEVQEKSKNFSDLGMSDKFDFVLQVATKVQNTLGYLADHLEKLWNLFTWQQPDITMPLFISLVIALLISCFVSGTTFCTLCGLYLGIKMFLIEFLFLKFPRIKKRQDITYNMWINLLTDEQLKAKMDQHLSRGNSPDISEAGSLTAAQASENDLSDDVKSFLDIFSFPISEKPLTDWSDGKSCGIVEPESKSISSAWKAFKYGKLYLTPSYLCFMRHKKASNKNIAIPLTDIIKLSRVKAYAWLPGAGMSIEVQVKNHEKPYVFGAMLYRDECFESIVMQGATLVLPWAVEAQQPYSKIRKESGKSRKKKDSEKSKGGEDEGPSDTECVEEADTDRLSLNGEQSELRLRMTALRMSDLKDDDSDSDTKIETPPLSS